MKTGSKLSFWFVAALLAFGVTNRADATKILHRNAAELASFADRVFVGICLSAEQVEMQIAGGGSLNITEYTFSVETGVKDVTGATYVLKQLGKMGTVGSIIGMPQFRVGEKYILFLRKESAIGLASPIGLGQGAFRVFRQKDGAEVALNFFNNSGLFNRMDAQQFSKYSVLNSAEKKLLETKRGPVNLEQFIDLIKKMF